MTDSYSEASFCVGESAPEGVDNAGRGAAGPYFLFAPPRFWNGVGMAHRFANKITPILGAVPIPAHWSRREGEFGA